MLNRDGEACKKIEDEDNLKGTPFKKLGGAVS